MSAEAITAALLADASITALVADRVALAQLPTNTAYPAIVYQIITITPRPALAAQKSAQLEHARIQINPIAATLGELMQIHAAVRAIFDYRHQATIAGKTVVSLRHAGGGAGYDIDNDIGLWTQPADYMLSWYK